MTAATRLPTGALSVAMVAAHWGTSDQFVYDLVKAGKLPSFKLGAKLIRIRAEALAAFEARAEEAAQPAAIPAHPEAANDPAAIGRLIRRQHSTA